MRSAAIVARTSQGFEASITISNGETRADAGSVLDLLTLASLRSTVPNGRGILNGNLNVHLSSLRNIQAKGALEGTNMEFSGGLLGRDHPRFQKVRLVVDGNLKDGKIWDLTRCDLVADPGSVHIHGNYDRGVGNVSANGHLDLPALFTQLPHLLKMQEGLLLGEEKPSKLK